MWCDSFDCDLYKLIPEAREVLAPVRDIELYVRGNTTDGKLNHPAAWNTDRGLSSFFGFYETCGQPAAFWTEYPIVKCTFEEAVRDLWVHTLTMFVEGQAVWTAEWTWFEVLMSHARGSRPAPESEVKLIKEAVLASLRMAAKRLSQLSTKHMGDPQ